MSPANGPFNVLLIGGGGREHAIAAHLRRSPNLGQLWVSQPTNAGLLTLGRAVPEPIRIDQIYRLEQFCRRESIDLVVIGPEEPLAQGFADRLSSSRTLVFGPTAAAARIEADKVWAKHLMRVAAIPTAEGRSFQEYSAARAYLESRETVHVVKAAGLAKGKGVVVPESPEDGLKALEQMMVDRRFGEAGRSVVIEERLDGPEVSILCLVDGRTILLLPPCQDHKRLGEGGTGPNTGGMGAFAPSPLADGPMLDRIQREILIPIVDTLRREGIEYHGVLYAGLILTHAGPKVLEFNVRFGDPECQAILPLLDGDLLDLMLATCRGRLADVDLAFKPDSACCVVLASEGYPESPRVGLPISGLDEAAAMPDVRVFHAGTRMDEAGRCKTAGGRVLDVTGVGANLEQARARAYAACERIHFDGMVYRRDIGAASTPAHL